MNNVYMLSFYIPELRYTFYGPIVFLSIIAGVVVAAILMKKAGVKKETVVYTVLLTFISILVFSAMLSILLSGDIRKVGFVGAGGALGLLVGVIFSALIHRDHITESISAWIVTLPLMYGLSKTVCHIAGCCHGIPYNGPFSVAYELYDNVALFPVQLTETITFLIIFIIGFMLYLKTSDKLRAATIVLLASGFSKIALEFLRESHIGEIISGYQILVFCITILGAIIINIMARPAKK